MSLILYMTAHEVDLCRSPLLCMLNRQRAAGICHADQASELAPSKAVGAYTIGIVRGPMAGAPRATIAAPSLFALLTCRSPAKSSAAHTLKLTLSVSKPPAPGSVKRVSESSLCEPVRRE